MKINLKVMGIVFIVSFFVSFLVSLLVLRTKSKQPKPMGEGESRPMGEGESKRRQKSRGRY